MTIRVDHRTIDATRIEGASRSLRAVAGDLLDAKLRMARLLAQIDDARHYQLEGCASIGEYAARFGISRVEAVGLCDLGRALRDHADLEKALRSGKTDSVRASTVARVLANPALVKPGDEWVRHACADALPALKRRVKARIDEFAQQATGVVELSLHVREETKKDFLRARDLASRKEKQALTHGQAFHRIVHFYLDKNDPLRAKPRKRRVPDTATRPDSRYVPAEVVRAVLERSGGQCEFPGCENRIFTELGHIVPHACGSGREADDFFHFCSIHHKLYDARLIRFVGGTVEAPIFWVKGVGTVCADTLGAVKTTRSPSGPPGANGGGGRTAPRKIDPNGDPPPAVAERGAFRRRGDGRYPLFESAFVHC
ncbi:MAG: hypothetical protein QNJ98_00940 [Planctomycetota bacterium]|nr:hypothetical protein [Planctomycetota bacterium]